MQMEKKVYEYLHRGLGESITAVGGHYALTREERLAFKGREVLYLTGYAIMDTACCGAAGCGCAQVQGFVEKWHYTTTPDGSPVTRIALILAQAEQKEIAELIQKKEAVQQVLFRTELGFDHLF